MSLPEDLPHLCNIEESAAVPDEYAADFDDPESFATGVPCWVQPASDNEINRFQRREQKVTHKVYFVSDLGLKPKFIIKPTTGFAAGKYLEVVSGNEASAGTGLLWRVMAEEIQPR